MDGDGSPNDAVSDAFSETAASIIAHANDDHADAVLAVARVQGGVPEATSARLLEIAPNALHLEVVENGQVRRADAVLDPPVTSPDTLRPRLIAMMHEADATLDASPDAGRS